MRTDRRKARAKTAGVHWRRAAAWWAARPSLAAATVYALLSLVMVAPGLAPGRTLSNSDYLWSMAPWSATRPAGVRPLGGSNLELLDEAVQFQPFLRYSRAQLPHIPLWNPLIMGGHPFVGDAQSAVFSPFSVPAYVLPFWRSQAVMALLKLFVAAFGTYLLARALGMRFGGALLAGIVYAFGLYMVVWLPTVLASVWVLIPWLLLLTELVVRRPGPLPVAGLAAVVGLQFLAGHPESSFHALFAAAAFAALRLVQARLAGRRVARPLLGLGVSVTAGTALAALMLLPFLEALTRSNQAAYRGDPSTLAEKPRYLIGLLLPDYYGRPTHVLTESFLKGFQYNHVFYAGALTLMLVVAAVLLRPTVERLAVAAFGAFSLAVVVGLQPFYRVVTNLPGFDLAKNARMIVLFLLCIALLAGWGLDDLSGPRPSARRRRAVLGFSGALLCLPIIGMALAGQIPVGDLRRALDVAWGFAAPPGRVVIPAPAGAASVIHLAALWEWVVLAGAGLVLLVLRLRRGLAAPVFAALAVALVAVDLFKIGMGQNPAISVAHAAPPPTGAISYLRSRRPARFVAVRPQANLHLLALQPNVPMNYGLYDARGYDYPVDRRFDRFWHRNVTGPIGDLPPVIATASPQARRALGLLSVADVLQEPQDPPLRDAQLAYQGPDARVYANQYALPRVFLVSHQRVVKGGDAALALVSSPAFDGRRAAVTERRVSQLAEGASQTGGTDGQASLVSYHAERVVARTASPASSMMVLTDAYYPGWQAKVDGKPASIHQVDYLLRGVVVPAGRHRVELEYKPVSWRVGWIVSAVALLALLATAFLGWRTRRKVPGD